MAKRNRLMKASRGLQSTLTASMKYWQLCKIQKEVQYLDLKMRKLESELELDRYRKENWESIKNKVPEEGVNPFLPRDRPVRT